MKSKPKKQTTPEFGKIIKGVEIPPKKGAGFPISTMQTGESFIAGEYGKVSVAYFSSSMYYQKKRHQKHFTSRKVNIGGKFYLQIWRTK